MFNPDIMRETTPFFGAAAGKLPLQRALEKLAQQDDLPMAYLATSSLAALPHFVDELLQGS